MAFAEDPAEFIDINEWADVHSFMGATVTCIVDDHTNEGAEFDAVMVHRKSMTVAASQLATIPVVGEEVDLNGLIYSVDPPVVNQSGIVELTLSRFVT